MARSFVPGPASQRDAKEYSRFCRIRRLFLVDGLETWRAALKARGLSPEEINRKISAAMRFVLSLEEPSLGPSGGREAPPRQPPETDSFAS
ncbi:MAG: hypothetical protein ABSG17_01325 [Spirochaetia bacterium]